MPVSREEVEKVARLARLRLSPAEVETFSHQLSKILEHVEKFRDLDLGAAAAPDHDEQPESALRADVIGAVLSPEEALYNAPAAVDGLFAVPRVLVDR
jgi:aspartyl-tRNA(Asn)/glutamyl-tRNA(Gln) amidotransferase subunit C